MTRNCYYDFEKNTINVSKSFMKKACIPGTDEYEILLTMQKDRPTAALKHIEPKKRENTYKDLTYGAMKEYVSDEFGSDSIQMKALVKTLSDAEKKRVRYATVKQWFLHNFPNYGKLSSLEAFTASSTESQNLAEAI